MSENNRIKIFLTGKPQVGKTTLIMKLFEEEFLKNQVRGFITQEIREHGCRVGFEAINFISQSKTILAHVNHSSPYRVGKYKVDVKGFDTFLEKLESDLSIYSLLFIDEIGPMELKSRKFKSLIPEFLQKNFIISVHRNLAIFYSQEIPDASLYTLTEQNRDQIFLKIKNDLKNSLLDF